MTGSESKPQIIKWVWFHGASTPMAGLRLASFPGRVFSIVTLGRKQGLVSIAWVIVHMRNRVPQNLGNSFTLVKLS